MLSDMTVLEGEFELRDEEPWYDKQDLEHDLHLAAELGKTLLDRNHELEQGLQQMYSTNQEQGQEIEYLARQVEVLRQVNEQHARVYEQLDVAARDLEQGNHRLAQENRQAQQRIHSLTETIEGLQSHLEELQSQVEQLTSAQAERSGRELAEQRRSLGAQSVSCLRELYDLQHDRCLAYEGLRATRPWGSAAAPGRDPEEEHVSLRRSVETLQAQLSAERGRREAAEQETELTARENGVLEQRLAVLEGCRARQRELEEEVEEFRLLWRADCASSAGRPDRLLLPHNVFFLPEGRPGLARGGEEEEEEEEEEQEEQEEGAAAETKEQGRRGLQRRSSDGVLRAANAEEIRRGHERMCIRRAEAVKQRGISLLNEVDAQYSALQVKYEELLRRCQQGADGLSHKAVQTPPRPHDNARPRRSLSGAASDLPPVPEDGQPEYKVLFQEIFTRIHKTREDLSENRHSGQGH